NFYNRIYRLYSGFLIISGAVLILFVKGLATILYAKEFFIAWRITPILILAYIFSSQAIFMGSFFSAAKKTKIMFVSSLVGAIVNIIFNILLIPKLEGFGAAIATVIGYVSILVINIINTRKLLSMDLNIFKNVSSYILIIVEIVAILVDVWWGYLIAGVCTLAIILLNIKEFIFLIKMLLNKIKRIKSLKVKGE
ncbi:MAG: polysaccharide biosynthesis C-terminal domain-containing protein, partial [Clostridia bacterium]|nr:polysaccharide biosynthesis C-terminal domain-containing protein [Clostridia bacterium]